MRKVIALSCDIDEEQRIRLLQYYHVAISKSGGMPVIMPPFTDQQLIDEWLDTIGVDAVLLTGGADIEPHRFGELPHEHIGRMSAQRDDCELKLLDCAIKRKLPILGICRGMQIINVGLGGTLVQDMKSELGEQFAYHDQTCPTTQPVHKVAFESGSKVAQLFGGTELATNSHHHQCVKALGNGLKITGKSEDGIIEAIESPQQPIVAVQFHPERMAGSNPAMLDFFKNWIATL